MKFFGLLAAFLFPLCAFAQSKGSPQDEEKQMRKAIDASIENLSTLLKLEDWQVFYLDSIMTHDYEAMTQEINVLRDAKMSNQDAYIMVQDKWSEKMYQAFRGIFNDEQWTKYLKSGAGREKKARDKRALKKSN
ncbi:MAG: hypothetical protein PUC96_03885 [Bacteroidales bacterium]|nr:hypothetical protein [Bacteroidales bacterium]